MKVFSKYPTKTLFKTSKMIKTANSLTISLETNTEPKTSFHLVYAPFDKLKQFRVHISLGKSKSVFAFESIVRFNFSEPNSPLNDPSFPRFWTDSNGLMVMERSFRNDLSID